MQLMQLKIKMLAEVRYAFLNKAMTFPACQHKSFCMGAIIPFRFQALRFGEQVLFYICF